MKNNIKNSNARMNYILILSLYCILALVAWTVAFDKQTEPNIRLMAQITAPIFSAVIIYLISIINSIK